MFFPFFVAKVESVAMCLKNINIYMFCLGTGTTFLFTDQDIKEEVSIRH